MKTIPKKNFSLSKSKVNQLGQGMTEYIIIVALIAIAAIGVFRFFGDTARNQVAAMALELGGEDGNPARESAKGSAEAAQDMGEKEYTLGNYASDN